MNVVTVTPVEEEGSLPYFGESPSLIGEVRDKGDIKEYLCLLLRQENDLYPPCEDYLATLKANSKSTDIDPVTEGWRRKLCEWAYEVVDHFSFDREVVFVALDYLDRFVSKWASEMDVPLPKKEYQLLAVTTIYMALKIHGETDSTDGPRRKLRIDAFYELSRKQFDVEIIEKTERHILESLNWNVNPPTALKFVSTLLSLCPKWKGTSSKHSRVLGGIYDVARYLSELSVCQSAFTFTCKTSLTAYASLLCAIEASHATTPLPYQVRVQFLNNIAEATGLVAGDKEVIRLCNMLKALCPSMFEDTTVIPEQAQDLLETQDEDAAMDEDRNSSPVCVIEEQQAAEAEASRRKRSRSEDWRPIHTANRNNIA